MARRLALLIGNSDHTDAGLARLAKPAHDVSGLARVLTDTRVGNFQVGENGLLINRSNTEINIAIEEFFKSKKSDDFLLLYFAGHGILDDQGRLYLAATNTQRNTLKATGIAAEFIADAMYESNSKRQILILDCCHSGAFARGARAVVGNNVGTQAIFERSRTGYARIVITATDATQYAFESDNEMLGSSDESVNSIFTRFLIQGLETGEADKDGNGEITHDELFEYVREKVLDVTPRQTPQMWIYKYEGKLSIAHAPSIRSIQPPFLQHFKNVIGESVKPSLPPQGFCLSDGHFYANMGKQPGSHILCREQDGQMVLYVPQGGKTPYAFLIDKYLITNAQYAKFLNSPEIQAQTDIKYDGRLRVVVTHHDKRLAGDALTYRVTRPNGHITWGLSFDSGKWLPIDDSKNVPVTFVTALGASWYAAWVKQFPTEQFESITIGYGLPTEDEWISAAMWDYAAGRELKFPWGDTWDSSRLNSASYWSRREFAKSTDQDYLNWIKNEDYYPTPINKFPNGASPVEMLDAFGNVWEWLADHTSDERHMIRGGACTSPQDQFHTVQFRQADTGTPYCGFRCCWPLR